MHPTHNEKSYQTVSGEKSPTPFGPDTCNLKCILSSPYLRVGLLSRPPPEGFPVVLGQPALLIMFSFVHVDSASYRADRGIMEEVFF